MKIYESDNKTITSLAVSPTIITAFAVCFGLTIGAFLYGLNCNSPQAIKHCIIVLTTIYLFSFMAGLLETLLGIFAAKYGRPLSIKEGALFGAITLIFIGFGLFVKLGLVSTLQGLL